jgi:hypothetical protein
MNVCFDNFAIQRPLDDKSNGFDKKDFIMNRLTTLYEINKEANSILIK